MYQTMPRVPRGPPPARKRRAVRAQPKRGVVKGKGFYKGFASDLGYGLGRVGNFFTGRNDLHETGRRLGQGFSDVTGLGAYKQNLNTLVQVVPEIMNARAKEGATIVRHKEYVCDIQGSNAFTIQQSLNINPGIDDTFPWVSQIANAYEEYEMLGMLVEFVTTSGNATGSDTSLGEVIISSEYNSYNPAFVNKQQMLNQIFAVSTVPSCNVVHAIECQPKQNQVARFYVRNGPSDVPIVLTDLCRTTIATSGNQGTNALGEIWITYELALYKPRLSANLNPPNPPNPVKKTATWSGVLADPTVTAGSSENVFYVDTTGLLGLTVPQDFNYARNQVAMRDPEFVTISITADTISQQGSSSIMGATVFQSGSPSTWSVQTTNPTGALAPTYYATHPVANPWSSGAPSWDLNIGDVINFQTQQGLGGISMNVQGVSTPVPTPVFTNLHYTISFTYAT